MNDFDNDDDEYYDDDYMEKDTDRFLAKIFINLVKAYIPSPGFDTIVREITLRLREDTFHRKWIEEYNKQFRVAKELSPENKYLFTREVFSREQIVNFAIEAERAASILTFPLTSSAKILADLLELGEMEILFLQLALLMSDNLAYQYHHLFEQFRFSELADTPIKLFAILFGRSEEEVDKALKGFLFQSGLLVVDARMKPFYHVNPDMKEAFCASNLTVETLTESLFPTNLTTTLDLTYYPHIEKEILTAERVISCGLKENRRGINVMFWGGPGMGKTELALVLALRNGWNLRVIGDISDRDNAEKSRAQRLVSLKIGLKLYGRDTNTVLLFDEMEDLFKTDNNAVFSKAFINRIIETTTVPIIWTTNDLSICGNAVLRRMVWNIGFETPPVGARRVIWRRYAERHDLGLDTETIDDLANTYDISPALIYNAVRITSMAGLETPDLPDVIQALDRLVHFGKKRKFDLKVEQNAFYDLSCVNTETDLDRLTDCLVSAKPNFSLLLYGPSGTGKSEYGKHVAKRLNKRVLFKRASDLMSMWVGETEKLIAAAFKKALDMEAVLIIDEGDSFLRDREGADRSWEVTQVNEMLSQMESHEQPFILTTNLLKHLDKAAMRRFTFKMKFDYLRPEQSVRLFESYFGIDAPHALARMETLTPGDFANVRKRADIVGLIGGEDDDEDRREAIRYQILDMLVEECKVKDVKSLRMGF